jgi:hypothetical protein
LTDDPGKRVAAQGLHRRLHPATLPQLHERLGVIEHRMAAIEARLAGIERRILYVGGGLALLMRVYRFL